MKSVETVSHASRVSKPGVRYLPVFDGRKRRIHGLWQRNSSLVARLPTETPDGRKKRVWHVPETAQSIAEAKQAMADLDWKDVDIDRHLVAIGADGQAKNAEVRHVDFNPALAALLTAMKTRRAPDSQWLFPSPQRGDRDIHAQTFRESLKLAREAIQMPNLGFHDTRHAFISRAVMAGIDFMTIARWVGHKDGGVLIGKVYGHIANEHRQKMAARLQLAVEAGRVQTINLKQRAAVNRSGPPA
jgi:hypothetical protein